MNAIATSPRVAREDIYARVTSKIVALLEQGVRPWVRPWSSKSGAGRITRPLRHNGQPYRGINVLMLWSDAIEQGFVSPYWLTFRQAAALKSRVGKGQHGSTVVYADRIRKVGRDERGEETETEFMLLKTYSVFNAEQVEGLPEQFYAPPTEALSVAARNAAIEAVVAATGAEICHGGDSAYYTRGLDRIQIPAIESFRDAQSYYATLLHELTHWTGHPYRLNRTFGQKSFGDSGYAREELVAELGAAFLCADLDISPEPREDHAAYLDAWLQVLKEDQRAIFQAAAHAQRACDILAQLKFADSAP